MAYKTSSALLAAIVALAGPAFAQDTTTAPVAEAAAETAGAAAEAAADSADQAADAAAVAADEAATAADAAVDAAADAVAGAADAAAETAETTDAAAAPADGAAPADAATTDAAAAPAAAPATPAEPQVGSYYVKSTQGDWTIRCIKAEEGMPDPCELYQLLKDEAGNSVAEVTLIPLKGGEAAAGATVVAPLETDLVRGLGLQIDAAAPRGYPFNFCAPVGCVSRMGFDANGLAGLKRGNKATVSLLPFGADPEKPVSLPMSLAGFTAGFTELEGLVAAAEEQIAAARAAAPADAPATEAAPAAEGEAAPAEGAAAETAPAN